MAAQSTDVQQIQHLAQSVAKVRSEIAKVIIGQDDIIDQLLISLFARGHCLLVGVPGLAKTLLVRTVAQALDLSFSRIQFTPDLMPSDITGTEVIEDNVSTGQKQFRFVKGPIFANILLADEINRTPPKTQAALLEAMQEHSVTAAGTTYHLDEPFFVLATQNPIEQEGTYRLPEAQLDRFLFKIVVNYPTHEEEIDIITRHHDRKGLPAVSEVNPILSAEQIHVFRQFAQQVHVEKNLLQYIAQITQETRNNPMLFLGASPRASISILTGAKAYAMINGRDFVSPEDIKFIALPVLRHRLILSPEKEMEGISADEVVKQIVDKIEVPR